jgi:hypothetical protein
MQKGVSLNRAVSKRKLKGTENVHFFSSLLVLLCYKKTHQKAAMASVSKLKDLSEALQLGHGRNVAVFFSCLQGRNPAEIRRV